MNPSSHPKTVHSWPAAWGTQLIWFLIVLWWVTVGQECLTQMPGKLNSHILWVRLTHPLSFKGPSSQALTLSGEARFIAWLLRDPSLEECQQDPRHAVMFTFQSIPLGSVWTSLSPIGLMSVCQWSRRPGFNPRLSHIKTQKMVLDATLLNTQHYKVWIKGKMEQFREWSNALSDTTV